ncbi:MAG: EamA family transporter [Rhodospirillaceae bacterium]|mgnify:CR=1 FL=1|nr:EamA family transporter [Rhodospirillaceae bacterium]|tara:strand:- start:725 stop:1627 length:903 start_codon:yes stop_codon:yes gene_type:complete
MPNNLSSGKMKGVILGILGILILSPDTLIIRLVDVNPWNFLAWRGALMTIGMVIVLLFIYGRRFLKVLLSIGWLGILIAVIFSLNTVFFQLSVQTTTVANTLVIIATAPLFAGIMSVLFLRERVHTRTWIAIAISIMAVSLVFAGKLDPGHLFGNLAALISAIGLGAHFVLVRLGREVDMTPAIGIASLFTCFIGFAMAPGLYLIPSQLGYLALLGIILLPASFVLLTRAPLYISAPEVSLILLLETILAPIWVWLVIKEQPPVETIIGGSIIIITLAIHAWLGRKDDTDLSITDTSPLG